MLHRIEPRDARLAIADAGGPPPPRDAPARAAGSLMRLPYGDVAADLKATGLHGRRCTTYELLVANDTPAPLATFAYAPDATTSRGRITWNAIVVPPFSAIAVEIDVALEVRRTRPRVVAEVYAGEAQLTLDAPPPQHDVPAFARRATAAASAVLVVALGAAALAQSRPRVLALAAPPAVRGSAPFTVAYALGAASQGRYDVETPEGLQIRRGTLDARSGAFTVALPLAPVSAGYDVRVIASGPLGSDERITHVVALPAPPQHRAASRPRAIRGTADVARVANLALERDLVHGGEPIVATYRSANTTGVVRLIDALGTVRAEALLNRRGRSILIAPAVDADQDFRVVATALRGTSRAELAAPVTIVHGSAPVAPAGTRIADALLTARAAAVAAPRTAAPIAVDPLQHPARPIVVRVDTYRPGLHVALMGASTDQLAGSDVTPGETSVVLRPPDRLKDAHYAIVATYVTGLGQETLIRPITFRAP